MMRFWSLSSKVERRPHKPMGVWFKSNRDHHFMNDNFYLHPAYCPVCIRPRSSHIEEECEIADVVQPGQNAGPTNQRRWFKSIRPHQFRACSWKVLAACF